MKAATEIPKVPTSNGLIVNELKANVLCNIHTIYSFAVFLLSVLPPTIEIRKTTQRLLLEAYEIIIIITIKDLLLNSDRPSDPMSDRSVLKAGLQGKRNQSPPSPSLICFIYSNQVG